METQNLEKDQALKRINFHYFRKIQGCKLRFGTSYSRGLYKIEARVYIYQHLLLKYETTGDWHYFKSVFDRLNYDINYQDHKKRTAAITFFADLIANELDWILIYPE